MQIGHSPLFGNYLPDNQRQNPFRVGLRFGAATPDPLTENRNRVYELKLRLTPSAQVWITKAEDVAKSLKADEVRPEHLAMAILRSAFKYDEKKGLYFDESLTRKAAQIRNKIGEKTRMKHVAEEDQPFLMTLDALMEPTTLHQLHSHTAVDIFQSAFRALQQLRDSGSAEKDAAKALEAAIQQGGDKENQGLITGLDGLDLDALLKPDEAQKKQAAVYVPYGEDVLKLLEDFTAEMGRREPTPQRLAEFIRGKAQIPGDPFQSIGGIFRKIMTDAEMAALLSDQEIAESADKVQKALDEMEAKEAEAEHPDAITAKDPFDKEIRQEDRAAELNRTLESLHKRKLVSQAQYLALKDMVVDLKNADSQHYQKKERRLTFVLERLPWETKGALRFDINRIQKALDRDHTGMSKVKDRVIEILAAEQQSRDKIAHLKAKGLSTARYDDRKPNIICFVGPPGVGKTSIAKSVAKAMGRDYTRIALGGMRDETALRGHGFTYSDSSPGRILSAMRRVDSRNPVVVLDEVDKVGEAVASALLEILDPEQNKAFEDHYAQVPYDLSDATFVLTANELDKIPEALRSRVEIVNLNAYSPDEKFQIARDHLIGKAARAAGLTLKDFRVTDDALKTLIRGYTNEAGVRKLEQKLFVLAQKRAKQIQTGAEKQSRTISEKVLEEWLGVPYRFEKVEEPRVGIVNGLSYFENGGAISKKEVRIAEEASREGTTFVLGDEIGYYEKMSQVAIKASFAYVQTNAKALGEKYGLKLKPNTRYVAYIGQEEHYQHTDGPSAGAAYTTALISTLTHRPVRSDVAMTGAMTMGGKVKAIGGLYNKIMAAYLAGARTMVIPEENTDSKGNIVDGSEIVRLPEDVRRDIEVMPVRTIEEVLDIALLPPEESAGEEVPVRTLRPAEPPQTGWASASTAYAQAGSEILPVLVELFEQPVEGPSDLKLEPLTEPLKGSLEQQANNALIYVKKLLMARKVPNRQLGENTLLTFNVGTKGDDPVGKGQGAGMAVAAAMLSELTGTPVRHDVVAIGGLDTKGNIEPVKDLSEQVQAAVKAGAKTVLIPAANQNALRGLPEEVRGVAIPVSRFEEAAHLMFERDLDVSRTHHFDLSGLISQGGIMTRPPDNNKNGRLRLLHG